MRSDTYFMRIPAQPAAARATSARSSMPGDLQCLVRASGALAGKNPRIQALPQPGEKKEFDQITPVGTLRVGRPLGRMAAHTMRRSLYPCASGHTSPSCELQPVNLKNLRLRHPKKTQEKPKKTQEKPKKTQEKPTETQEIFANPASRAPSRSGDG